MAARDTPAAAKIDCWGHMRAHQIAQDTVEYGLIIVTIAIVVLVGITAFGNLIEPWFTSLAERITTVGK